MQVLKAQELIGAGAIGQIVCARTHYSGGQGFSGWQLDPTAGGTMLEMVSCHDSSLPSGCILLRGQR